MRSLSAIYWAQAEKTHCKGVQLRMQRRLCITFICLTFEHSTLLTCFRDKFAAWADQSKWIGNLYTRLYVSKGLWDIWPCANGYAVVIPCRRLPKFYTLNDNSSSLWRPCHPEAILFREPRSPKGSFTPCHGGSVMPTRRLGVKSTATRGAWNNFTYESILWCELDWTTLLYESTFHCILRNTLPSGESVTWSALK